MIRTMPRHDGVDAPGNRAEAFFDDLWRQGDPWGFETSDYDQASYRHQVRLLSDRRYARALEIGCGAGAFTRHLAPLVDRLLAIDVAPAAIHAARQALIGAGAVDFRVANIMESEPEPEAAWDLVVLGETIYYLGWLYPFFDVYWLAHRLLDATRPGGRLIMTNTSGGSENYLQRPALIRTYRDLFINVGYELSRDEVFTARKNGTDFVATITVFAAPRSDTSGAPGGAA